jgi:hypothetical protein
MSIYSGPGSSGPLPIDKIIEILPQAIELRRLQLSNHFMRMFDNTVQYGLFKGLKLPSVSSWAASDRSSLLFGVYEEEVVSSLTKCQTKHRYFVDIGAGDGYYGIGVLVGNYFEKSYCFELSEKGQENIRISADLNKMNDRVTVYGGADSNFLSTLPDLPLDQCAFLIDIEGGEFDLLSLGVLSKLQNSVVFIELHDWLFSDGNARLRRLKEDAGLFFNISELQTTARDMHLFPELATLCDNDRWLICSEGRARLMTWLRLDPR